MNLASLDFALSHISSSIANLTKKNYKQTVTDLNQLTAVHGQEAERHLYRCLFSFIDFSADGKNNNGKDTYQIQLLQQECVSLIAKPNCASVLCFAIENPLQRQKTLKASPQLLSQISRILKLNKLQEVVFGVILLNSSNSELRLHAKTFTRLKFPDLISSFLDTEAGGRESGLHEAPVEVLYHLLVHLVSAENPSGTSSELREQFLTALRKEFPRERAPVILTPLLYAEKFNFSSDQLNPTAISLPRTVMEVNLADSLREIGYACTSDKDRCRQTLTQLGGVREVTAKAVAQVLGMMARTIAGLQDGLHMQTLNMPNSLWVSEHRPDGQQHNQQQTWNVDVFVQVVQELSPSMNWREVVKEFDHPGFLIPNKHGLQLVTVAVRKALHGSFPVEELFRPWENTEGQLSWFVYALNNPDVFCFASFQRQFISIDMLKAPPDDDNMDIATWKSAELVESLLRLSDLGHYQQVSELFKFPVQHCADLLIINILQTQIAWNTLKKELIISLIPLFLGNHPNSGSVLQFVWNYNSHGHQSALRTMVMFCMADWYLRGGDPNDQTRLSRILDVAQDLKALSMLLNLTQFTFVIDLACLASRREYLKLDKWLTDKIRDHADHFVEALTSFLKRRCPALMGFKDDLPHMQSKGQLSLETVGTILALLQNCMGSVRSEEVARDISTMLTNAPALLNKPRPLQQQMSNIAQGINLPGAAVTPVTLPPTPIENSFNNLNLQQNTATGASPAKFPASNVAPGGTGPPTSGMPSMPTGRHMTADAVAVAASRAQTARGMPNMPSSAMQGDAPVTPFSADVEDEANGYFQKIYNQPPNNMSIDQVLDILKQFKDSSNKRERDVFSCMLRNLFDENRFFPQYPDRELLVTATLFGGIIEHGLVQHMALGMSLKNVLEALKQDPNSKMYLFGIAALEKFRSRLKDCAQYCQHIVAIPHFSAFPPGLQEYVNYGKLGKEPPIASMSQPLSAPLPPAATPQPTSAPSMPPAANSQLPTPSAPAPPGQRPAGVIGLPSNKMSKPSLAHTTNIDTLLAGADDRQEGSVPPEGTQDRVFFIFNNLSQMNMQQKAEELLQTLQDEFVSWTAQYLVMKRASIEPNFHPLYSSFLDALDKVPLNRRVLLETFRNIKVLLRSDKGVSNFSDRSLLKNLGHWLGLLTLAKNKPILQLDLDLKALLYEANSKGSEELLYVVPFVAKVLESCEKSRVFKPPNPWTMGILCVLNELHQQPDLKLNLKFEIEVLCKNLHTEMQSLPPTHFLMDESYMELIECQLTTRPKQEPQMVIPVNVVRGNSVGAGDVETGAPAVQTIPGGAPQVPVRSSPQPQYTYNDISVASLSALAPHIQASDHIALFQMHKHFKPLVRQALEKTITELCPPVVERAMKISLNSCESIIKKDFALDPEEQRMMGAAHHLVRGLTAGMALITCKDPLLISLQNNLKTLFLNGLRGAPTPQQKDMIEQAAQMIAQDNAELACCYIQKSAVEKAIPEIDKRLAAEFECRQTARAEGRRYCDPVAQRTQMEKIPEALRLKPGSAAPQQMSVYEEFARNVPGFASTSANANFSDLLGQQNTMNYNKQQANYLAEEVGALYEKLASEMEGHVQLMSNMPAAQSCPQQMTVMQALLDLIKSSIQNRDVGMTAVSLVQKVVDGLLEGYNSSITDTNFANRFRECHLLVLKSVVGSRAFGNQFVSKHVTRCLLEFREDFKANEEAVECLMKAGFVNVPQYDYALSASMENGGNYMSVNLAMKLVQKLIVEDKGNDQVTESDFPNTIESLAKIAATPRGAPDGLPALIEAIRLQNDGGLLPGSASGPTSMMQSGINQAKDINDPPGLLEKTEYLLREWVHLYHNPSMVRDSGKMVFNQFVTQMQQQGILKSDDLITRFIRASAQLCVDITYNTLKTYGNSLNLVRAQCFKTLDAYVKLMVMLIKLSGDANNTVTKVNLLNKMLGIVAGILQQDHEAKGKEFQQLPFHRIFIMLFIELNAPEQVLETINFQVLTAFSNTYRILRPAKAPGFAFAWLELISHRAFIGRMLQLTTQQRGWNMYAQLLIDLFKFLAPFLRNADLNRAMQVLYKGTLRVLLVLLHDFPEFLCEYHYAFCDVIPPNCIQMRNLILSAFPRNMRLPDPFTPNLKVDMLQEISLPPKVMTNVSSIIQPESFRKELDSYLKTRSPATFPSEVRSKLQISKDPGNKYNIPLMNALVLYVGTQAIQALHHKGTTLSADTIGQSSHMDIFQSLSVDLDTEGRYLFLNAITNQLRFPNSHTHYFSCALLSLFSEAHSTQLQEQITRVLLERLIVNRPHPWGLLVTFIELIRNQSYRFWGHDFVHCSPEIERLFETVARSCNQNRSQQTPAGPAPPPPPSQPTRPEADQLPTI